MAKKAKAAGQAKFGGSGGGIVPKGKTVFGPGQQLKAIAGGGKGVAKG